MKTTRRKFLGSMLTLVGVPIAAQADMIVFSDGSSSMGGGGSVPGGVFIPASQPIHRRLGLPHHIEISFVRKELAYYRNGVPVLGYKVVTPRSTRLRRGRVVAIESNPQWCVGGTSLRQYFYENGGTADMLRGGCLPGGHPLNPMGNYKFLMDGGFAGTAIRLHGTRSYDFDYQEVETLGCVRLMNGSPGIDGLVAQLGPNAVHEGIEMVFF